MSEGLTERLAAPLRRYKPYPAMKDSGVEWLGAIPEHWNVNRLKDLATMNDETLPESTDPQFELSYVDISSVDAIKGIVHRDTFSFAKAPSRARRIVRHGDVIVSTVRTYLRAFAAIEDPEPHLVASTGFAVIRPTRVESSFAAYALRAPYFVERVVASSVGVSYPAINAGELACFPLTFPDLHEQRLIAAFLDRETAKIDALVAKKERLIELLREKREALIARAVTRGFGSRPLTGKGAPLFPEFPAGWRIWKIRRLIKQVQRPVSVDPDSNYREIGIRSWGRGIFHKKRVRGELLGNKRVFHVEPGDLVLNIVFAWEGAVGVISSRERGMVASHRFPTFRSSERVDLDYFLLLLQSERGRALMAVNSPGAAGRNRTIRLGEFLDEEVPLPPFAEQTRIVNLFRGQEKDIYALVSKVREAIDRLKELRTALISAVVTGKIDVREEVG